jgi:hypothetical protein
MQKKKWQDDDTDSKTGLLIPCPRPVFGSPEEDITNLEDIVSSFTLEEVISAHKSARKRYLMP